MNFSTQIVLLTIGLILEIVHIRSFIDRRLDAQEYDSLATVLLTGLWVRNETL